MNNKKWQQGFLMIDALLAIVIISGALVAIITMFIQATKATHCSAQYTKASNLAYQQMELLKNTKTTVIKDAAISSTEKLITIPLDAKATPVPGFTIQSTAKQCLEKNSNDLAEVTVTVSWVEGKSSYHMPITTFFIMK